MYSAVSCCGSVSLSSTAMQTDSAVSATPCAACVMPLILHLRPIQCLGSDVKLCADNYVGRQCGSGVNAEGQRRGVRRDKAGHACIKH